MTGRGFYMLPAQLTGSARRAPAVAVADPPSEPTMLTQAPTDAQL